MTDYVQILMDQMTQTAQEKQDSAFFHGSGPAPWTNDSCSSDVMVEDILELYRFHKLPPAKKRIDHIVRAFRALMKEHGFNPDKGDLFFVSQQLTFFWTEEDWDTLPDWVRDLPFGSDQCYMLKAGHEVEFAIAQINEFVKKP